MLLRTRILLLAAAGMVMVAIAVGLPAALVVGERGARIAALQVSAQSAEVARALDDAARPLLAVLEAAAADPALAAALDARDETALQERLGALGAAAPAIARIEVIASGDRILAAHPGPRSGEPMLPAGALLRELTPGQHARGVERSAESGSLRLVAVRRNAGQSMLAAAAPLDGLLERLADALAGDVLVADLDGQPLTMPEAATWRVIDAAGARRAAVPVHLDDGERSRLMVPTVLPGAAGMPVARLIVLQDVSAEARRTALVSLLAAMVLVGIVTFASLTLYRTLRGALDPLTGLSGTLRAIAGGDILASATIPARRDEVGEIAHALNALRSSGISLERLEARDRLFRRRHLALIRSELSRLSEVLEETEQAASATLLERVEAGSETAAAGLAEAFESMASGVLRRHHRLTTLLEERTRDLEVVRAALEQRVLFDRMVEELEVARRLQLASLPSEFPQHPAFAMHATLRPAKEVGGDFYDVVALDADRVVLMVGDASGKGVSAAIFIAMARSLLRAAITRGASPAEALAQANATLCADNPEMMFATVFVGIFDARDGLLRFASAGHNPPRLLSAEGGEKPLHAPDGIALGVVEEFDFEDHELRLQPGERLLLFSDGVTEAIGPGSVLFGDDRLAEAFRSGHGEAPDGVVAQVLAAVDGFAGDEPQADDITILCFAFGTAGLVTSG